MFKLICVLSIYIAVGLAADEIAEIDSGHVYKGKDYPGVTIESRGGKTEIIWNESFSKDLNALRATYAIHYTQLERKEPIELKNLCESTETGSKEYVVQQLILYTIANVGSCPVPKGTKASFSTPSVFKYSINKRLGCGPYESGFKVFKESESDNNAHPIMTVTFRGNITGC